MSKNLETKSFKHVPLQLKLFQCTFMSTHLYKRRCKNVRTSPILL